MNNPYAKYFKEQTEKVEKDLKNMIDFFTTWKAVQKSWSYLLPIFSQKDIGIKMMEEHKLFFSLDDEYRETMDQAK